MKRVELDGDELILRLFENGEYQDIKFVRDQCKPKESNCWIRVLNYAHLNHLKLNGEELL